jgi:amino acid transporter
MNIFQLIIVLLPILLYSQEVATYKSRPAGQSISQSATQKLERKNSITMLRVCPISKPGWMNPAMVSRSATKPVHHRGIEFGSLVQNILTLLKIGLIAALIFIGFAWGDGSIDPFLQKNQFTFEFAAFKRIGLALSWIMFAYSGWSASTYIGSEIRAPGKNLPGSLLW